MDGHKAALSSLFDQSEFPEDAFYIDKVFVGRKIIVYGAGECCHWPFMEVVVGIHGYMPSLVLDLAFKEGDTYEGVPAFSPSDYLPTEEDKRDAIVVICVGKQQYHAEIIGNLKALGFQNIIRLLDVYEVHNPFNQPVDLKRNGFKFYLERKARVLDCLELFADDESREIFTRVVQTHMRRKPVPLPERPRNEQYFPKDIRLARGYSRFVCCGADTGTTVRQLNGLLGKVEAIACIEPDPWLFAELADYLLQDKDQLAQSVVAFPCAVYGKDSIMRFTSANHEHKREIPTGFGSRVKEDGETFIQTISLDHTLPGFKPTHICMDVEGAELEALKGAEAILRENRPDLAICVYHAPHHVWEIPLYIHGLGLGYRFYLRNYTSFITETVVYATV